MVASRAISMSLLGMIVLFLAGAILLHGARSHEATLTALFNRISLILVAIPLQVLYLSWATKRFFDTAWWSAFLAACFSLFAWFVALTLLIGGCVAVAVSLS